MKRKLRNLVRGKKNKYETSVVNDMCENLSNGEQKKYWKLLRKLENTNDSNSYIPDIQLVNHFKELLQAGEITKLGTNRQEMQQGISTTKYLNMN